MRPFKTILSTPRVGVILNYKEHYLCVFQSASHLWGFPKGRIQYNETREQGACRELKEETGVYVDSRELSDLIHIRRGKHHHFYFFKSVSNPPLVTIDNYEIADSAWLTLEQLAQLPVSFFTEQILRRLKPTLFYQERPEWVRREYNYFSKPTVYTLPLAIDVRSEPSFTKTISEHIAPEPCEPENETLKEFSSEPMLPSSSLVLSN
jgi:8-oxo-dGTP pyrophosphatase MutT (NUDIX family)